MLLAKTEIKFLKKCENGKNFAWTYFRESITSKLFVESYLREFGQKPRGSRKLIPRIFNRFCSQNIHHLFCPLRSLHIGNL